MNKNQAVLSKQIPEVLCMLLPLMDDILLVPTVSVAEMANLRSFDDVENTPEWFFRLLYVAWIECASGWV